MPRSALSKTLLVMAALLSALIGAAIWSAPSLVEKRIIKEAAARGVRLEMGGLSLSRGGITMRGLSAEDIPSGARATIDSLEIDAGLWKLFRRRAAAIEGVRIRGFSGEFDTMRLFEDRLRSREGSQEDEAEGGAPSRLPQLSFEGSRIRALYEQEVLADVFEIAFEMSEGALEMTLGSICIPLLGGEKELTIAEIVAIASLEERVIDEVRIGSVNLSALSNASESERLIGIARALMGLDKESDQRPEHEADQESDEAIEEDGAEERDDERDDESAQKPGQKLEEEKREARDEEQAGERAKEEETRDRTNERDKEQDMGGDHDSPGAERRRDRRAGPSLSERWAKLSERLADDFSMQIDTLILPAVGGFGSFQIDKLRIEREEQGGRRGLSIKGSGQDAEDARADFDLTVSLSELRADGRLDIERLRLGTLSAFFPWIPFHEPENGRLDVSLLLNAGSLNEIAYEADLDLHQVGFYSPRIAADPIVDVAFGLTATGKWRRDERALSVASGEIRLAKAKATLEGELRLAPENLGVDLKMSLPRTNCEDAVHAIPKAVLGSADAFHFRGMMSGELALSFDWEALDELELSLRLKNDCRFVDWPKAADTSRFMRVFVHEALSPDGEPFDFETGPMTEVWSPLETLSPYLLPAFLAHEDGAFLRHPGFSVFAIRESLIRNLSRGRFERGASTITMQLAKNLFLNREKVLVRKLREVLYTWWLESAFGKEHILELYANVVELGPYIYGVKSASLHYFGRDPADLSPAEAAFLATSLPAPRRAGEQYERGELSRSGRSRMGNLLRSMKRRNLISEEAADYGLEELDDFRFYRRGDPLPPERVLPETPPLFEFQIEAAAEGAGDGADQSHEELPRAFEPLDPWGFP